MKTIFIRHKLKSTNEILETLWQENLIAVLYLNIDATDPEVFKKLGAEAGARALKNLHSCIEEGAIVGASYHDIYPSRMKIGRIVPGESRLTTKPFTHPDGTKLIYKVVNLVSVKDIDLASFPVLLGIQPMKVTLTGWDSTAKILEAILDDQPLPISVYSMHPSQLEILCYEYLRSKERLVQLLTPIGRGMQDIDICGVGSDGEIILAQVTFSNSKAQNKIENLCAFAGDDRRLFYFAPMGISIADPQVNYRAIEDVFAFMENKHPDWVENLINPRWIKRKSPESLSG